MTTSPSPTHCSDLASVGDWIRYAATRFAESGVFFGHGTATAADEARALVFHALSLDFDCPDYFYRCALTDDEKARIDTLLQRRISERLPLPYLTNEAWFCGLSFYVDERVLIPRSPLGELIAEQFSPWLPPLAAPRILDMCTGSGCIAIAIACFFDTASVVAVDVDEDALAVAARNVEAHGVGAQVTLRRSDLFADLPAGEFDLIVCNPPYVPAASLARLPDEYAHEPVQALVADDDGLDVVGRLLAGAGAWLSEDGILVVEVGESAAAFAAAYADLDVAWCEFEHGGEGVFVVSADALRAYYADADDTIAGRLNHVG